MEALPGLINSLTHSIHTLSSALNSSSNYIAPLLTGLIGTFSGLIVVVLQSRFEGKRAIKQREEERKRDVFKAAAIELARLPGHITSLQQMTEGKAANKDEFIGMSAVLDQIVQVATSQTARLAIELSGQISRLGASAVNQLFELNNLQSHMKTLTTQQELVEKESSKITATLQDAKINGGIDKEGKQFLYDATITLRRNLENLNKERHQLAIKISQEQVRYLRWCRANLKAPLKNCFELKIRIRQEFDLPVGEKELRKQYVDDQKNFDEQLENVINNMEKSIVEQIALQGTKA